MHDALFSPRSSIEWVLHYFGSLYSVLMCWMVCSVFVVRDVSHALRVLLTIAWDWYRYNRAGWPIHASLAAVTIATSAHRSFEEGSIAVNIYPT